MSRPDRADSEASRPKVFLTGGDNIRWALDTDLALTRQALDGLVAFSAPEECEVVHSVFLNKLATLPEEKLAGKRLICHLPGDFNRFLTEPGFTVKAARIGLWIAQNSRAEAQLQRNGYRTALVPYTVSCRDFYPMPSDDPALQAFRAQWRLPTDAYLIGNFHRDTEGRDLKTPKWVKGPDLFVETLAALHRQGLPVHAVLAGPRRFWIRKALAQRGIPYTFVGETIEGRDDLAENTLPAATMNMLYNAVDLYLVSSRSEGGPRSLLEAVACRRKVLSTDVGLAPDLLEPLSVYAHPVDAVSLIRRDIESGVLDATVTSACERLLAHHQPQNARMRFSAIYERLAEIPPYQPPKKPRLTWSARLRQTAARVFPTRKKKPVTVGLWQKFMKPPYGGGNQFMLAMRKALLARGIRVRENEFHPDIDVYLLNAIHFDMDKFLRLQKRRRVNVVHRIDGPIHLIRGFDREKDALCYEINEKYAQATIIQSTWTYQRIQDFPYQPVNPTIIRNAVDPDIFNRRGKIPFETNRKIRLIASSWSDNPRKGGPLYKWLEKNLDWDRYEFTFVGKASEPFERIRQIAPVPSEELAELLRQHDIYITASRNDPCSNALIEALSCGLPALYLNDGGHPELAGYGGLPFSGTDDILEQLEKIAAQYEMFRNLIVVPDMDEVADKYLAILLQAAGVSY